MSVGSSSPCRINSKEKGDLKGEKWSWERQLEALHLAWLIERFWNDWTQIWKRVPTDRMLEVFFDGYPARQWLMVGVNSVWKWTEIPTRRQRYSRNLVAGLVYHGGVIMAHWHVVLLRILTALYTALHNPVLGARRHKNFAESVAISGCIAKGIARYVSDAEPAHLWGNNTSFFNPRNDSRNDYHLCTCFVEACGWLIDGSVYDLRTSSCKPQIFFAVS
jgi:hypothetical protein